MPKISWKAALGGGLVAGAGFAGFTSAQADRPSLPVDDVQLRFASHGLTSPSQPVVTSVPRSTMASVSSVRSSVSPVSPAPTTAATASVSAVAPVAPPTTVRLPDICPTGDHTGNNWDNSCGAPPPAPAWSSPGSPASANRPASPAPAPRHVSVDSPASPPAPAPASPALPASAASVGSAGS